MPQENCSTLQDATREKLTALQKYYLKVGLSSKELQNAVLHNKLSTKSNLNFWPVLYVLSVAVFVAFCLPYNLITLVLGIRCMIPNNYFIFEATRPISDCSFCSNVTKPIILYNVTQKEFKLYAYTSKPIVVKQAFLHWPALKKFSWQFFKNLYAETEDSYKSVDEECQFLHFKSDFISIRDVFAMSENRVKNLPGEKSWYVGWGNCHPTILREMRKYYPKPHFLPDDAEIPHKEYVFMGYDDGATMHLDFINRLMWQAQLQGSKVWNLLPPPECQSVCGPVSFSVEPGDGVLVDTRIWYHATTIPDGEFSLSIQSEYG